jgi:hypothetical protein
VIRPGYNSYAREIRGIHCEWTPFRFRVPSGTVMVLIRNGKEGVTWKAGYSYRSATIGSTFIARRAGRNAASSAMATREMVAPTNSEMSVGLMP